MSGWVRLTIKHYYVPFCMQQGRATCLVGFSESIIWPSPLSLTAFQNVFRPPFLCLALVWHMYHQAHMHDAALEKHILLSFIVMS